MFDAGSVQAAIATAISVHARWKERLRDALRGGCQQGWSADEVARDDQCTFAKWLVRLPPEVTGNPRVDEVREAHRLFHLTAAKVIVACREGRQPEAEAMLGPGGAYADASAKLIQAMKQWQDSLFGPRAMRRQ